MLEYPPPKKKNYPLFIFFAFFLGGGQKRFMWGEETFNKSGELFREIIPHEVSTKGASRKAYKTPSLKLQARDNGQACGQKVTWQQLLIKSNSFMLFHKEAGVLAWFRLANWNG